MSAKYEGVLWLLLMIGFLWLISSYYGGREPLPTDVSYSEFREYVSGGRVESVLIDGNQLRAELKIDPITGQATQMGAIPEISALRVIVPTDGMESLLELLEDHSVTVRALPEKKPEIWVSLLPWVVLLGLYFWFQRRMMQNISGRFGGSGGSGMGGPTDFLGGSARHEVKSKERITFADVAGQEGAKAEVAELVSFLKNPDKYRTLGAESPRGVLLMGPPGTGKTLLAKALAGEAKVPFFSISASEFIEMFVGVGASRVRAMFNEAKKRAPSIIFIDELDSIGRVRGTGLGGGHDEREQTLNQILSEMDGFSGREAVIVLAATNRPDILDPALLRPGRFDRHVTLELPDRVARLAILEVHCRKVPLAPDADLDAIASGTPGFSGADLKNLVNEAAMAAAREEAQAVHQRHLDSMRDKVLMGTVRTLAIMPDERHRLAVHEAGHTAVAYHLPHADPLYKVTIIPRGRSLGSTHMLQENEHQTLNEDYLRDRLAVMLGGRVAEKLLLGNVSSGADDDIRAATRLARAMVAQWGMASDIGPVDLRQSEDHPFLGREIAQPRTCSDATVHQVDMSVQKLLLEAEARASKLIKAEKSAIKKLIEALEANETLDHPAIAQALGAGRVTSGEDEITKPPTAIPLKEALSSNNSPANASTGAKPENLN